MLVACQLAGLSALAAHYAGRVALTQSGPCWPAEACSESAPAHCFTPVLSKPWVSLSGQKHLFGAWKQTRVAS
jgi:hypothetical protein